MSGTTHEVAGSEALPRYARATREAGPVVLEEWEGWPLWMRRARVMEVLGCGKDAVRGLILRGVLRPRYYRRMGRAFFSRREVWRARQLLMEQCHER